MHTFPVTPATIRVLREDREREITHARQARLARTARARPRSDAAGNRPVSAWSSLLVAVRRRQAA